MREYEYPLWNAPANLFIGKNPAAVMFGNARIEVKKWSDAYRVIYGRVNQDPQAHEDLMYLRNKAAGNSRIFISDSPDGMRNPLKVDEEIYVESHYGVAGMFHIMVDCILRFTRFDLSEIKVIVNP